MAKEDLKSHIVKGYHQFTLENYLFFRMWAFCEHQICSDSFMVGGYEWGVTVFPSKKTDKGKSEYVGFFVRLKSVVADTVHCFIKITLVDQSGQGKHKTASTFDNGKGPLPVKTNEDIGFPNFIRKHLLLESFIKDDCLKMEFTLGLVLPSEIETETETETETAHLYDNPGLDFLNLLETGEGCDVVFDVKGEKFYAHKVILSARSSVFELMIDIDQPEEIIITGIEPHVFKVLLHFIYSDNLPDDEKSLTDGYAFGASVSSTFAAKLLAAADAYNVIRLKSICESHLWTSISLNCFAEIILLADRYNASSLKRLCFEYAANANFYAALVELDSFRYLQKNGPSMLIEELNDYLLSQGRPLLHLS